MNHSYEFFFRPGIHTSFFSGLRFGLRFSNTAKSTYIVSVRVRFRGRGRVRVRFRVKVRVRLKNV